MATRLYPITKDPINLEKLAVVPAGTYAKLTELNALKPDSHNFYDPDVEAWYDLVEDDPDVHTLYNFIMSGWGRVRMPNLGCAGIAVNPVEIARIMAGHDLIGIDWTLTGGLCWH